MEEKKFFDIFRRYQPSPDKRQLLEKATEVQVRFSKEPYRVEVNARFPKALPNQPLYEIEEELRVLYGAVSFRIFPSFPSEEFHLSCMKDILEEGMRVGAITQGFFEGAVFQAEGEDLAVTVPFDQQGVNLIQAAKTGDILSRILYLRFGVDKKIRILPSEDAAEHSARRRKKIEDDMAGYIEEGKRRAAARMEEEEDPHADFTQRVSLVATEEPPEPTVSDGGRVQIGTSIFDASAPELILGTEFPISTPTPIATLIEPKGTVILFGQIFESEAKENRDGTRVNITVGISDSTSSIYIRKGYSAEEGKWIKNAKVGQCIVVKGSIYRDKFDNALTVSPRSISKIKMVPRTDDYEGEKRVELHLHTVMSTMDAIIHPEDLVDTAVRWGHKAIAVTDHGNVQAFPEVMLAAKDKDIKILYGMEAYFVNDTARAVYGAVSGDFDREIIVFDIETTGKSPQNCKITEIGAVKIRNGEILERFNTFVNPECPIPEEITALTSITNEMVADAPKIKEVLPQFFEFIGDRLLVAHNANFDVGFIRAAAEECELPFSNPYLDTVALSRYVNPELSKHKLDYLATHYGLEEFHHHRACDDAEILAMIFFRMVEQLHEEGVQTFEQMGEAMSEKADPLKLHPRHMIMLAQNQTGLRNLYEMISQSYLTYYKRNPRIPKSLIQKHREGVLIGSACEAGELYQAILDNRSEAEIEEIADFYDYLEIQPDCNNAFLLREGKVANAEGLHAINRRIIALGRKLGKMTVATCDAHFLNKEDEIYRKILLAGMKFGDADKDVGIYLRTTQEMLDEFAYLGEDLAREVVIENPNRIADMIEPLRPIPKGTYNPKLEGAEEELKSRCWTRAHEWYGDTLPEIVEKRLDKELTSIISNGYAVLYVIAQKLVTYSESLGYQVGSRGSVGSSFVAIMDGISEVNPLPPHYRCLKCRHSEFFTDGSVGSGFDLPDKNCPHCGIPMYADGHDIPFETFLGFYGDKCPDIDLNFSGDVQGRVHKYTESLFGEGHVFRAGTLGTLASKTAFGFVQKYLEERKISLPRAEVSHLVARCVGVKRTTGQHPGGIIVVPKEYDVHDFTPVQHPADDPNSSIITTHFPFEFLHDTILKLDELGHDMPTKYKMLERYTNTSVLDVKMNDQSVYRLFESVEPLGIKPEDIDCELGTYGLPELGTRFIQGVLMDAKPKNFADLLQISGLTHGTNVWLGNAQDLIKEGICDISKVIGTRDGIMLDLIRYGLENSLAFKIMESVRKGKGLSPEWEAEMRAHNVPDWYIGSCKKIKYMFPKAHAAAYVMSAIRLGWYKIYYPMEFYAGFLSVASGGFDAEIVGKGRAAVTQTIKEIEAKGMEATQKEAEQMTTFQLVRESMARGVKYLPVSLEKSDTKYFLPENGQIRMPFMSLNGLGETAAERIVQVREAGKIYSVEELRTKAGLSRSVIDILRRNGVLDELTETNQLTLF